MHTEIAKLKPRNAWFSAKSRNFLPRNYSAIRYQNFVPSQSGCCSSHSPFNVPLEDWETLLYSAFSTMIVYLPPCIPDIFAVSSCAVIGCHTFQMVYISGSSGMLYCKTHLSCGPAHACLGLRLMVDHMIVMKSRRFHASLKSPQC